MKRIYDISQEVFGCEVYFGDPRPERQQIFSMEKGDLYNLTSFSMCAHNGTHVDAPYHFYQDGKTVEAISLDRTVGLCSVVSAKGNISRRDAEEILKKARSAGEEASKKILIKGDAVVSLQAAEVFAAARLDLLGNESQSVGPEHSPMAVHLALLGARTVLLEGIRLGGVEDGVYFLSAAPLSLAGADGSPCRAYLMEI